MRHLALFPSKKKKDCSRAKRKGSTLTEVVVIFGLSGVADLLDVDVGGSSGDPHHCVITWKKGEKWTEEKERLKRMESTDWSHVQSCLQLDQSITELH